MKKVMLYLLALGTLVMCPFTVSAKTALEIGDAVSSKESEDKKSVEKTYEVYVKTTEGEGLTKVTVKFDYGKAITKFNCADADPFVADQKTEGNVVTCEYALPSETEAQKGDKILVGKVVLTADKNASDEDCHVNYTYEGATGKINPNTGISVPYAFILGGVVLAASVYFATSKKSKLVRL